MPNPVPRPAPFLLGWLLLWIGWGAAPALAQEDGPRATSAQAVTIGTKPAPPFVIDAADGELEGLSIYLWEGIAERLSLDSTYEQASLEELLSGLETERFDYSVAALTLTAEREKRVDFSHPFYTTGLGIAVSMEGNAVWLTIKRVFSWQFLAALLGLAGLLFGVGTLLWLFERRHNPEQFGGRAVEGLGASFWWAAVTMTTVGYGDKAPVTLAGRIVGLVWMFAAIIIISSFTAAIATSLTVGQLESAVEGAEDLDEVRVASIPGSAAADYLEGRGIRFSANETIEDALADLSEGRVDAVVYDAPLLRYLSNQAFPRRTRVLAETFERQDYAIAMPEGDPRREAINQALLEVIATADWQRTVAQFLGED